jgi:hypothetical protein
MWTPDRGRPDLDAFSSLFLPYSTRLQEETTKDWVVIRGDTRRLHSGGGFEVQDIRESKSACRNGTQIICGWFFEDGTCSLRRTDLAYGRKRASGGVGTNGATGMRLR